MARVTVEDGLKRIHNRFILSILAAKRTRQLLSGAPLTIKHDINNKAPVLSLRELADGTVRMATDEEAKVIREKRKKAAAEKLMAPVRNNNGDAVKIEDAIPLFSVGDNGSKDDE
jgi:DNA-directed RNA polymerase subunit omega